MTQAGIRALHAKEIWKSGHRYAEIGGRIIICPAVREVFTLAAGDIQTRRHQGDFKASCQHNDVGTMLATISGGNAGCGDFGDICGFKVNMILADGCIPTIIKQDPFAIGRITWQTFGNQIGAAF